MSIDWVHLVPCMLGLQVVPVRSISGDWARALVDFRYPDRDGAEQEDLGREPAQIGLDAVFYGPTYEADFQALLTQMNAAQPVLFTHPHHGSLMVRIRRVRDRTSVEGAKFIEADIELGEATTDNVGFSIGVAGVAGVANAFDEAASAASAAIGALA